MTKQFKRTTVTSALPYANGPVHIGHLAGVYVPADVYKQIDKNVPAYIPAALKRLELIAVENSASGIKYGKMSVSNHKGIEEIVFPKETASIDGGAVEKCPNLKVAYVPKGVNVSQSAFSGVHADFKIVYTE